MYKLIKKLNLRKDKLAEIITRNQAQYERSKNLKEIKGIWGNLSISLIKFLNEELNRNIRNKINL